MEKQCINCRSRKGEAQRYKEVLESVQWLTDDDHIFRTIEAALHPKPPKPSKDGFPF